MGAKGSKQPAIQHPHLQGGFITSAINNLPSSVLTDIAGDNLKAIELSNGDIVTLKNACALFEENYTKERLKADSDPKGKNKATSDADLCIKFIAKNLQQLLKSKKGRQSLLLLSQESLLRLLDSDDLVLRSEYELLLWVAAWANYQIEHEGEEKNVQKANTEPEENKTTDVVTATPKINLRESAGLFSHLAQGVSQLRSIIESGDGETKKSGEQKTEGKGEPQTEEAKDVSMDKSSSENKEEEKPDESSDSEDENLTEEEKKVKEIRKRLAETEWEFDDKKKPDDSKDEISPEDLLNAMGEDDEDAAGPRPMIDLRGTAGLFHHMSQGAMKVLTTSGEETKTEREDKDKEKEKEKEKQTGETNAKDTDKGKEKVGEKEANEAAEGEMMKLIAALDESEEGWEATDPLPLPILSENKDTNDTKKDDKEEDEDFFVPDEKLTSEYVDKLKKYMEPFFNVIRFTCMSPYILELMEAESIVPMQYIREAYKVRFYNSQPDLRTEYLSMLALHPRYKPRRYVHIKLEWNPQKKHTGVQLSADRLNATAVPGTGCAHKSVLTTDSITYGRHIWTVTLHQMADCYAAVGVVTPAFDVNTGQMGITPGSWGLGLYPGTHAAKSDRRIQCSTGRCSPGALARLELDMEMGELKIYLNGKIEATYHGITGPVFPALTLCELNGGGYTLATLEG